MKFSVEEALNLDVMRSARLMAGKADLGREIIWVNVNEIIDEYNFFKEGEFLITTGRNMESNNPDFLEGLVEQFIEKKIACLAIQTGYYLPEIPPILIEKCEKFNLPLIELPKSMSFTKMIKTILERVLNCQLEKIEYAQRINRQLTEVSLEGKGLNQVAKVLSKLVNTRIVIVGNRFNILAHYPLMSDIDKTKLLEILLTSDLSQLNPKAEKLSLAKLFELSHYWIEPIKIGRKVHGYIAVNCQDHQLSDFDLIAVSQATMIVALEMLKNEAVFEAEERLKGDFLDELIEGNFTKKSLLRASHLGFKNPFHFTVMIVDIDNFVQISKKVSESELLKVKQQLLELLHSLLALKLPQTIVKSKSDKFIILLQVNPEDADEKDKSLGELIRKKVETCLPATVTVGIGRRYSDLADVSRSYQEAEKALSIGKRLGKKNQTVSYDELNVFLLFNNFDNLPELEKFYQKTIGPLVHYDTEKNANLFQTLESYFQNSRSVTQVVDSLFIHRHTLRYRLNRIKEITGLDPQNHQDAFQLQLGMIIAQSLESGGIIRTPNTIGNTPPMHAL